MFATVLSCVRAAWLRCALPHRNTAAAAAAAAGEDLAAPTRGTAGAAAAAAAACGIARMRSLGRLSLLVGLLQLRSVWPDQAVVSTRENYEAWLSYWTGRLCHSERNLCQAFGSDRAFSEVSLLRDNAGFNSTSGRLPCGKARNFIPPGNQTRSGILGGEPSMSDDPVAQSGGTTAQRRNCSCRARFAPAREDSALFLSQSWCQYTPDSLTLSSLACTISPHPPHLPLMHSEW